MVRDSLPQQVASSSVKGLTAIAASLDKTLGTCSAVSRALTVSYDGDDLAGLQSSTDDCASEVTAGSQRLAVERNERMETYIRQQQQQSLEGNSRELCELGTRQLASLTMINLSLERVGAAVNKCLGIIASVNDAVPIITSTTIVTVTSDTTKSRFRLL